METIQSLQDLSLINPDFLNIEESLLTAIPSSKDEPDSSDLSELEDLLQESLKLCPVKAPNKRIYKELKASTDAMIAEQENLVAWEVLDTIAVWTRTKCRCGKLGDITFCRFMQKTRKVGAKITHWETIGEPEKGIAVKHTLTTREVLGCGGCALPEDVLFEDFQEVTK